MNIGSVEIPIIFNIEESSETEVDEIDPLPQQGNEIDPVVVKHEPSVQQLTIIGYLNEELHSSNKTLSEQKKDIKGLRDNSVTDNTFTYRNYNGHLLVEDVSFSDNLQNSIVNEVQLDVRYLPWPKYYKDNKP